MNGLGCVKVLTNSYSVPLPAGIAGASQSLCQHGGAVARGATAWPGMSAVTGASSRFSISSITWMCCIGSRALWPDRSRWSSKRQAGLWPASFDRIWQALMARQGKQSGTRQMIDLLKLGQQYGRDKLQEAVEAALAGRMLRCRGGRAPADARTNCGGTACEAIDVGALERYARPLPVMTGIRPVAHRWEVRDEQPDGAIAGSHDQSAVQDLRMPMMAAQFGTLAEQAIREKKSHIGYLEALLLAEIGRAGTEHHRAPHPGSASAAGEDAGRVRLHAVAECDRGEDAGAGRGRLSSNAPNPFCSSANAGRARPIFSPGSAWRLAGRSGGCGSPRRRPWSMNWWKPSINSSSGE